MGAILINAGTLAISGGSAINNANSVAVASGATFEVNGSETINALSGAGSVVLASGQQLRSRFDTTSSTFSGGMSGTGQFLKGGSGTLVLSGANSYSGLTTFEAGTILAGHNDAFGTSTVMFDWNDNSAKTMAANGATARTIANSIQIYNNLTLGQSTVNTGSLTFSGGVALGDEAGTREITVADGTSHTFSGVVSGLRGIVKKGTGSLTLSGNNTFSGASYLVGGTTVLSGNTGAGSGTLFLGEESGSDTATLAIGASGVTVGNAITVRAGSTGTSTISALNTSGTATFSGTTTLSKAVTLSANSGGNLALGAVSMGNNNITYSGANNVTISGAMSATSGTAQLQVSGTGTLTLSGNNSASNLMKIILNSGTLSVGSLTGFGTVGDFYGDKINFNGGTLLVTENVTIAANTFGMTTSSSGGTINVASGKTFTQNAFVNGNASGAFHKTGAGTLVLGDTGNTGTSTFNIKEGTVSVAATTGLGSGNAITLGDTGTAGTFLFTGATAATSRTFTVNAGGGTINISNSGTTLTANDTITYTGTLTKAGDGKLILGSASNTGAGGIIINAGTLESDTAGKLGTGTVTLAGTGTLGTTASLTRTAGLVVTDLTSGAAIDVASGTTFTQTGAFTGAATASTKIGKSGAGTLIFNASSGSTFGGQIQIGQGVVIAGTTGALGANNSTGNRGIDLGLNVGDVSQANNVSLLASNGVTVGQSIYVAPNTTSATRTIGISGSGTATFNNEIYLGGDLIIDSAAGGNTVNVSGKITQDQGGAGMGIIKSSAGTATLSGANDYKGSTTINAGVLQISASNNLGAANNSVLIASGATLRSTASLTNTRAITISTGTGYVEASGGTTNTMSGTLTK
ncbi:MAG: beta strand repeat-containing protein, partial [Solirubrobacterales bacterium]